MWLITNIGFFSIVEKPEDQPRGLLTVRARVKADLEALKDAYLPSLSDIFENQGTDYKYRAKASRAEVADALSQMVFNLDYTNFKNSVAEKQGPERAHLYHEVWTVLNRLQEKPSSHGSASLFDEVRVSYGGVLIDSRRQVLLRKPTGEFDGYVWTFPKGKAQPGFSPEKTALTEVKEETGYEAIILGKIPGRFEGGTGVTGYFIMRPVGEPGPFDRSESEEIRWVSFEEAAELIAQTRNAVGKKRDQAVLQSAISFIEQNATAVSWRTLDLPVERERLPFKMRFSLGEMGRLRKGCVPQCQEEKWFIYYEGDWLTFHRSWTGYCVYRLRLERDGECYRVAEAWVNRNREQYTCEDPREDEQSLLGILFHLFKIGSDPYSP